MARRNINSVPSLVPTEVVDAVSEGNKKVEEGAARDSSKSIGDVAQELFRQLMKDLKEKRQQAKDAGKSQEEVKAIKFNDLKGTDTYEKWEEATREVEYAGWKEIEQNLHNKLDKAQDAGEDVEQSGLFDQWEKANARFEKISQARKEISQLKDRQAEILAEQARVAAVSQRFPGSAPRLVAESNRLAADEAVVAAEVGAVGGIIYDGESAISTAPTTSELVRRAQENFFGGEGEETGENLSYGRGAEKIINFFQKELSKIKKTGNHAKDIIFADQLKQFVGTDEVFADVLLNDSEFKNTVLNFFNAKGEAKATAALDVLIYKLGIEKTFYEKQQTQSGAMTVEANPVDGLDSQPKITVEGPASAVDELRGVQTEMSQKQTKLEELKKQLEGTSKIFWLFNGTERTKLLAEIKTVEAELAGMIGDLAETAASLVKNDGANSNKEIGQAVADQALQLDRDVKSGNIRVGSNKFVQYSRVIAASILGLLVASSVSEVGGKADREQPQAGSTVKLNKGGVKSAFGGGVSGMSEARPDAPNGFTEAINTSEMPTVSPLDGGESEPEPEVAGGFTSAGDLLKPAQDMPAPAPGTTYKLKKSKVAKGGGDVEIAAVNIGGEHALSADVIVAPVIDKKDATPKREYTSKELSEQIEEYSGRHTGSMEKGDLTEIGNFNARESGLLQTLYEASRTGGQKGFDLLAEARTKFLMLNDNTSKSKLEKFQFFIDGLQKAKDREKPATPKEGTPSLDEISQSIEAFSANFYNVMPEKESNLTDLLYKASKNPGKKGRLFLKQAIDTFSFVKASPEKSAAFQSFINDLTEAHKGGAPEIPDLVFPK